MREVGSECRRKGRFDVGRLGLGRVSRVEMSVRGSGVDETWQCIGINTALALHWYRHANVPAVLYWCRTGRYRRAWVNILPIEVKLGPAWIEFGPAAAQPSTTFCLCGKHRHAWTASTQLEQRNRVARSFARASALKACVWRSIGSRGRRPLLFRPASDQISPKPGRSWPGGSQTCPK